MSIERVSARLCIKKQDFVLWPTWFWGSPRKCGRCTKQHSFLSRDRGWLCSVFRLHSHANIFQRSFLQMSEKPWMLVYKRETLTDLSQEDLQRLMKAWLGFYLRPNRLRVWRLMVYAVARGKKELDYYGEMGLSVLRWVLPCELEQFFERLALSKVGSKYNRRS